MPFKKGHTPWNKGKSWSKKTKKKISESKKGQRNSPNTEFKKGHEPWNKGKNGTQSGEENGMWKRDDAGVTAIHLWVASKLGKPKRCEHCGTTEADVYHWANKNHSYKRNLKDWMRLCISCHRKYDYKNDLMGNAGFQEGNYYGK